VQSTVWKDSLKTGISNGVGGKEEGRLVTGESVEGVRETLSGWIRRIHGLRCWFKSGKTSWTYGKNGTVFWCFRWSCGKYEMVGSNDSPGSITGTGGRVITEG
jgi:hypothetical protein